VYKVGGRVIQNRDWVTAACVNPARVEMGSSKHREDLKPGQQKTGALPTWLMIRSSLMKRREDYSLLLTRENMAPWGSWPLMIQPPPGTCIGPFNTFPPPDSTRLTAALIESTLK
jgi:hypothetical protein